MQQLLELKGEFIVIADYQRVQRIRDKAESYFDQAWLVGRLKIVWAYISGQNCDLKYLSDIEDRYTVTHFYELERQPVDMDKIVGTNGRSNRFMRGWNPVMRRSRNRWVSVCLGLMEDVTQIPPIEVIQVGDEYYVMDGNHRVSAAKALGKLFIDANVTVWEVEPK